MHAGASPTVCLSFAGWLSHCLLSHASVLHHLLLRSRHTRPSSTPPLCSRQLFVASHLFAPPLPLDAPPPHDWLCRRRRQCAGVVAVDAQASLPLLQLRLSPSSHIVKMASLPLLLSLSTSASIVITIVSRRAVAIAIVINARRAIAIIVDFVAHCAVAIIVVVVARRAVAIVIVVVVRCAVTIVVDIVGCRAIAIIVDFVAC